MGAGLAFFSKLLNSLTGTSAAPPTPSPDEREVFALRLRALVQAAGQPCSLRLDPFSLDFGEGTVAYLDNRFATWQTWPPNEREAALLAIAEGIVADRRGPHVPETWDDAAPRLLLRLRARSYHPIARLQLALDGRDGVIEDPIARPVTDDLIAEVAVDLPHSIATVGVGILERWEVGPEEALARALDNLQDSAARPFVEVARGVYAAEVGDCYDSARLLLEDPIRALPLAGDAVALPANRDTLLLTGEHDLGGLHVLLSAAMEAMHQPRLDTLHPLVLRDDGWHPWWAPRGHALEEAWGELAIRTRGSEYAQIHELLTELDRREGVDRFIAKFGGVKRETDRRLQSMALWPRMPGLLPEVDLVNVVAPDEVRVARLVPWRAVVEIAGHQLRQEPDLWPPHHAVEDGPDGREWEQLARQADSIGVLEVPD